jgi:hypothetical protein
LGSSGAVSFDVGSFVSGCGIGWGRVGVIGCWIRESDGMGIESMVELGWGRRDSIVDNSIASSRHFCFFYLECNRSVVAVFGQCLELDVG